MKRTVSVPPATKRPPAFTLIELAVVLCLLALGVSLLAPALSRTQPNSKSVQCLNNHRQLLVAWRLYAEDNADQVVNNFGVNNTSTEVASRTYRTWANNIMSWNPDPMNTNQTLLQVGILAPFLNGSAAKLYKCPADNYVSPNQAAMRWPARTRSLGMNGFFGPYSTEEKTSNWSKGINEHITSYRQWLKFSTVPRPANYWVFIDEHPDSINDGYFLNNPTAAAYWGDMPASWHNGGSSIAFVDGHAESHRWLSTTTIVPVRFSYVPPTFDALGQTDYQWLMARTAVRY